MATARIPLIRLLKTLGSLMGALVFVLLVKITAEAWQELRRTTDALAAIEEFRLALAVMEKASRERGPTNGLLGTSVPHSAESLRILANSRQNTDTAIATMAARLRARDAYRGHELQAASEMLVRARQAVDELAAEPLNSRSSDAITAAVAGMVSVVQQIRPMLASLATQAQISYPSIGDDVHTARLVAELRECAGLLGSQFTAALVGGRPMTQKEHDTVQRTRGQIDELRLLVELRMPMSRDMGMVTQTWQLAQERYFNNSLVLADQVIANSDAGRPYGLGAAEFAQAYVPDMNALLDVQDALLERILRQTRAAQYDSYQALAAVVVGAAVTLGLFITLVAVVRQRILRPLMAVARAVDDLSEGQPISPIPYVNAKDEMAAVVGAVRTLQERTQQWRELEKERDALIERLRDSSNTDPLTELLNRRGLFEAASRLLSEAQRHGFEIAVYWLTSTISSDSTTNLDMRRATQFWKRWLTLFVKPFETAIS